jgi:serine/threonine-protein kinase
MYANGSGEKGNLSSMSIDPPQDPFTGKMIRGYCLEELLGRGTATAVYRARTEELWQIPEIIITILLVPDQFSENVKQRFETRFLREAKRISLLRHPFLFPLYGYGVQENIYYLIAPDVQGQTLASRMREMGRFSPADALAIVTSVADALGYIHSQNVTYQFLQPANILFTAQMDIQITGLGLPQLIRMSDGEDQAHDSTAYGHLKNYAGKFIGAPEYLAPEVVKGVDTDARADVYSLGIMLFEMLSGQQPFTGANYEEIAQKHVRELFPSLHEIAPDIPVALELVVNRAIQRNPEQRFPSVDELITAYSHALHENIQRFRTVRVSQKIEQLQSRLAPSPSANLMLPSPDVSDERHLPMVQSPDSIHASEEEVGHKETPEHNFLQMMETLKQDFLHSMETLERDRLHSMEVFSSLLALSAKKDDEPVRSPLHKLQTGDTAEQASFQREQFLTDGEGIDIFVEPSRTGPVVSHEKEIVPHEKEAEQEAGTEPEPGEANQHQLTWYQPQTQTVQDMAKELQSMRQRLQKQSKRPVLPASSKRTVLPETAKEPATPEASRPALPETSKGPVLPETSKEAIFNERSNRPVLPASSKRSVDRKQGEG